MVRLSRSSDKFLVLVAFAILSVALLLGILVERVYPREDSSQPLGTRVDFGDSQARPETAEEWIEYAIARGNKDRLLKELGQDSNIAISAPSGETIRLDEADFGRRLDENGKVEPSLLKAWWMMVRADSFKVGEEMVRKIEPSTPFALEMLGRMAWHQKRRDTAAEYFREARKLQGGELSTKAAVAMAEIEVEEGHWSSVGSLLKDSAVREGLSQETLFRYALRTKDFRTVARILLDKRAEASLATLLTALFLGLCWFSFLLFAGEVRAWSLVSRTLLPASLCAGIVSLLPTLFWVAFQNEYMGDLGPHPTLPRLLTYFVAGVGLREEVCKLIVFVPFALIVLRLTKGTRHLGEMQTFILASMVGLGFAVGENAGYFEAGGAGVGVSRFLTANFLHISLTGLAGHALFVALRDGEEAWYEFSKTFVILIAAHGLYDFLLVSQILDGYLAMTVFILASFRYFETLHRVRRTDGSKLLFPFTIALSCAIGFEFVYAVSRSGLESALDGTFVSLLSSALIAYMFFRAFGFRG